MYAGLEITFLGALGDFDLTVFLASFVMFVIILIGIRILIDSWWKYK